MYKTEIETVGLLRKPLGYHNSNCLNFEGISRKGAELLLFTSPFIQLSAHYLEKSPAVKPVFADVTLYHELRLLIWPSTQAVQSFILFSFSRIHTTTSRTTAAL